MAQAVQDVLRSILARFLKLNEEDATKMIMQLKKDGRYQEDIFG